MGDPLFPLDDGPWREFEGLLGLHRAAHTKIASSRLSWLLCPSSPFPAWLCLIMQHNDAATSGTRAHVNIT